MGDLVPRAHSHLCAEAIESESLHIDGDRSAPRYSEIEDELSSEEDYETSTPSMGLTEKDRPPMLALPPTPPLPDEDVSRLIRPLLRLWTNGQLRTQSLWPVIVRGIKSVLLVSKVNPCY